MGFVLNLGIKNRRQKKNDKKRWKVEFRDIVGRYPKREGHVSGEDGEVGIHYDKKKKEFREVLEILAEKYQVNIGVLIEWGHQSFAIFMKKEKIDLKNQNIFASYPEKTEITYFSDGLGEPDGQTVRLDKGVISASTFLFKMPKAFFIEIIECVAPIAILPEESDEMKEALKTMNRKKYVRECTRSLSQRVKIVEEGDKYITGQKEQEAIKEINKDPERFFAKEFDRIYRIPEVEKVTMTRDRDFARLGWEASVYTKNIFID